MVRTRLLVLYTQRITECREFYTRLGLTFVREQHGIGPEHYAATLADGLVLELYPGTPERATGALRLGFELEPGGPAEGTGLAEGVHRDPDGRAVEVRVH
ncbi:hypothetical protein GCM10023321_05150 [Pseudonocardia eucalypti]|uniref:Guanosine polyphosphate pyrophosphohydrolase n=1 Tax=Pseudonocardia eucalypti TaxID=648755 RepID=A0ABP9PG99_9PSEU|nr:catechol 2,3-dioxygenase-like lactoylglutathione lyase family enzyme [Pseudonocardia eucalypti]